MKERQTTTYDSTSDEDYKDGFVGLQLSPPPIKYHFTVSPTSSPFLFLSGPYIRRNGRKVIQYLLSSPPSSSGYQFKCGKDMAEDIF